MDLALAEHCVQGGGGFRSLRCKTAHHPVVGHQLDHDPARKHPFRAVRHQKLRLPLVAVQAEVRAQPKDQLGEPARAAGRRRRLQDHQFPAAQLRGDSAGGGSNVGHVARLVRIERGRHGHNVGIRGGRFELGPEPPLAHRARDVDAQVRFHEGHVAVVDGGHGARIDVDADHLETVGGQDGRCGQPDVTKSDDGDCPDGCLGLGSLRCQHVHLTFHRISSLRTRAALRPPPARCVRYRCGPGSS
ncbi:hypothetical protein SRABI128_05111 [Microbacterium sp. Bi128]|nr:hypothetical protein SRABI128_05111 [Microbacterium sp. Bi128]